MKRLRCLSLCIVLAAAVPSAQPRSIDYGIESSEIERYVVFPGQACSYMIGQLKILELRERAKTRLKDRFSERAFHNAVLGPGSVPLDLLESATNQYIRKALN